MAASFSSEKIQAAIDWLSAWLLANVLTATSAVQLAAIAVALVVAWVASKPARALLARSFADDRVKDRFERARPVTMSLVLPVLWLVLLWFMTSLAHELEQPGQLIRVVASLLSAWVVIRVSSSLIAEPFWSKTAAVVAWSIAALNVLHLLQPIIAFLDGFAITLGQARISAFVVLKGVGVAAVLLWAAVTMSTVFQRRIEQLPNLTPSVQVLISQTLKVALVSLAIIIALGSVGIDLTAFAVFSGAVGVGVGFGLQKIVSNLISGIILLIDRSIKPGDVIEIGGSFGQVNSLGARYASVITRDGAEHLIPNEDLITLEVVNWSYSSRLIRRKVAVGVSYNADIDLATALILDAAKEVERILDDPAPKCQMKGFGDSSVDLELRFWINDPQNGVSNVADLVLRKVWHKFREHSVEIPFPQRDLHIRSATVIPVKTENAGGA